MQPKTKREAIEGTGTSDDGGAHGRSPLMEYFLRPIPGVDYNLSPRATRWQMDLAAHGWRCDCGICVSRRAWLGIEMKRMECFRAEAARLCALVPSLPE